MFRIVRPVMALLAVTALAAAGCGGSDETQAISAYPSPGTPTASPDTEISFVGAEDLETDQLKVVGSESGEHSGELSPLGPSTEGVSFKPDEPFTPQETVTVETGGDIVGVAEGDEYSFETASFRTDASLPPRNLPPESKVIRHHSFKSRPDLKPPVVKIAKPATAKAGEGRIFISPKVDGPMIINDDGSLVYFRPSTEAADFRVQAYDGEPVLTWWQGPFNAAGHTEGTSLIANDNYEVIARVRGGNGYQADLHEFKLTDRGTAYITIYKNVLVDLTPWGGPKRGAVLDSIAQEIDIETGEVVWEWHSLGNIDFNETYIDVPESPTESFDYFHINSIDEDDDGNLIMSGRNTFSAVKVDRDTGEIIWRLGGKESDFKMGKGTNFSWQHDALRHEDGTISIYDNASSYFGDPTYDYSRGLILDVDEEQMTAKLANPPYVHPDRLLAPSQGNLQVLPNGNRLVGWGSEPWFTEFSPDGKVQLDGTYYARNSSYRTYREPWTGHPTDDPAIATERKPDGRVSIWVSWNGATEVDSWRILAGSDEGDLTEVDTVPKEGFETRAVINEEGNSFAVEALGFDGEVLGRSPVVGPDQQAGPNSA